MDFQVAPAIQEALTARVSGSGFGYEYKPDSFGEAQSAWYKEHYAIDLEKNNLLYSPTISTSLAIIIENFSDAGNGIIIQPPVYMEFKDVIRQVGRRLVKNPLKLDRGKYEFDFEDLAKKASLPENKILILCNPHNPVGRVWSRDELKQIVEICHKNDVVLIADEIHKDIILFDNEFNSVLHFSAEWDKIFICTSEAKTFNFCGISDSMIITSNKDMADQCQRTLKKYNLGRTNALTRVALESAYRDGQEWLKRTLAIIESNVISIEEELENSEIVLIKPEGTYQVWLDFRKLFSDSKDMFEQVIEKTGYALNAGHWFGREGALFMRMNIATSNKIVSEAITKINSSF